MLIACDVDDVVANLADEWFRRYNRDYHDDLTPARCTSYDVTEHVKPEAKDMILRYLEDSSLYPAVRPMDGALAGVTALRERGHRILFVTHCWYGMADQKAQWLQDWGFLTAGVGYNARSLPEDLIVTSQKHLVRASVLIDDSFAQVSRWVQETKTPAIMMHRPHNAACRGVGIRRAASWTDVLTMIDSAAVFTGKEISPSTIV